MNTTVIDATEYRNVPLAMLTESKSNPRRSFEHNALHELATFVPGNKIGLLCRCPFCGRGHQKAHGNWRSAFRGERNG
jgi:hypothetical protein